MHGSAQEISAMIILRRSFCDLKGNEGHEGQGTRSGGWSAWTQLDNLWNGTTLTVLKEWQELWEGTSHVLRTYQHCQTS